MAAEMIFFYHSCFSQLMWQLVCGLASCELAWSRQLVALLCFRWC